MGSFLTWHSIGSIINFDDLLGFFLRILLTCCRQICVVLVLVGLVVAQNSRISVPSIEALLLQVRTRTVKFDLTVVIGWTWFGFAFNELSFSVGFECWGELVLYLFGDILSVLLFMGLSCQLGRNLLCLLTDESFFSNFKRSFHNINFLQVFDVPLHLLSLVANVAPNHVIERHLSTSVLQWRTIGVWLEYARTNLFVGLV